MQTEKQAAPRLKRSLWRVLAFGALIFLGFLFCLYLGRAPILTALARAWIVDEPVTHAGAIIVLGGGLQTRTFAAATMYQKGVSTNILLAATKLRPTDIAGLTQPERVYAEKLMVLKGVPPDRIQTFGESVASTRDEAVALREWIFVHPDVKSVIIATDTFHTRRVKWIFKRVFGRTAIQVHVVALGTEEYTATDWWQHEEGLIGFQTEVVKYLFYQVKYRNLR